MASSHQRITVLLASFLVGPACKTRNPYYCEGAPLDNCTLLDTAIDAPGVCTTFSTQLDTCALGMGTDLTITGNRIYNTDTHVLVDVGGGNAVPVVNALFTNNGDMMDVIVANSFTLTAGSTLRVVGSVAFGIVATEAITIQGTIDAVGGDPSATPVIEAAGARELMACEMIGGKDALDNVGGGPGGGGAGFRGLGGNGGLGDADGVPVQGATGGSAEAAPLGFPRGGCHGGNGGNGAANTGGKAGRGGGAVDLVSAVSITIDGGVNVGGSGGLGGIASFGGGGGGGSGGMIVLEAPMIDGMGSVTANGGGGGGGAGATVPGTRGENGTENSMRASGGMKGGSGSTAGGNGGGGGAGSTSYGETATNVNGGGGGGGGGAAGYIRVIGATPTLAVISPAPS